MCHWKCVWEHEGDYAVCSCSELWQMWVEAFLRTARPNNVAWERTRRSHENQRKNKVCSYSSTKAEAHSSRIMYVLLVHQTLEFNFKDNQHIFKGIDQSIHIYSKLSCCGSRLHGLLQMLCFPVPHKGSWGLPCPDHVRGWQVVDTTRVIPVEGVT